MTAKRTDHSQMINKSTRAATETTMVYSLQSQVVLGRKTIHSLTTIIDQPCAVTLRLRYCPDKSMKLNKLRQRSEKPQLI